MNRPPLTTCVRALVLLGLWVAASPARAASDPVPLAQVSDDLLIERVSAAMSGEFVEGALPEKCMVPHLAEMQRRGFDLQAVARAAVLDLAYETPEGHFRVEYAITGADSVDVTDLDASGVPDYVEWVGEAMEQSWAAEIDGIGFPALDLGGGRYKVQLKNAGGFYGWTNFRNVTDPGGSNIVLNADFAGFYRRYPGLLNDDPDGLIRGAIRVTAAHEFKHALQVSEGWPLDEPIQWYELDATSLEDLVFDDVNDYYNYIRGGGSPFTAPATTLIGASYEDATWQLFHAERFGTDLLVDFSALRSNAPTATAQEDYRQAVVDAGHEWVPTWREYAVWTFLSGERADAAVGFEEAAAYPTAVTIPVSTIPTGTLSRVLVPWANAFHLYDNTEGGAEGGMRVVFSAGSANWGVAVVLQNASRTEIIPLHVSGSAADTLEIRDLDVAAFERIALVVGNAEVGTNLSERPYSFSLTADPALLTVIPTSFGGLKGAYTPPPDTQ